MNTLPLPTGDYVDLPHPTGRRDYGMLSDEGNLMVGNACNLLAARYGAMEHPPLDVFEFAADLAEVLTLTWGKTGVSSDTVVREYAFDRVVEILMDPR
jgi:hypothetical protein